MNKLIEKRYSPRAFADKNVDKDTLKQWYSLLSLGRQVDERAPNYLKQAIGWSYHAPYAGLDGIQLAIGQAFTMGEDHLFPQPRSFAHAASAFSG